MLSAKILLNAEKKKKKKFHQRQYSNILLLIYNIYTKLPHEGASLPHILLFITL